jgi:hypothetical protein
MRILISNDGMHAHFFERMAWANAFKASGIECVVYNCKTLRAFDVFDKFQPDIFIGQLYNLDRATIKCISERPHLKVALRAGEYRNEKMPPEILQTTDADLKNLNELIENHGLPSFIYTHYFQQDIEDTHHLFKDKFGIKLTGVPMSGDILAYGNAEFKDYLQCDIGFVGGYWLYKGRIIDQYLTRILNDFRFHVKIFGNQLWPHVNQYCGVLNDEDVKNLFVSAKICPNLSEPHSHTYGIDVNERAFKVLAAGGFCIMDNVKRAKEIFKDGVVFVDSDAGFEEAVEYFVMESNTEQRMEIARKGHEIVMKEHTNFHRASTILENFGEHSHADNILKGLQ